MQNLYDVRQIADEYLNWYATTNLIKQFSNVELIRGVANLIGAGSWSNSWSPLSASSFPFEDIYTPTGLEEPDVTIRNNETGANIFPLGDDYARLVYVIFKGGQKFYVWQIGS